MLLLLIGSVAGTLFESNYNAEYAGLKIYKTWWFLAILFFLWINILFAALSRLPWKKRHVGFLITHLGMLMLLLGSVITMQWGIDGTMQIYEGSDSNLVFLQNNVIEFENKKIPLKRYLEKEDLSSLSKDYFLTTSFGQYLPFVDVPEKSFDRGQNLNFKIKSPFFDVVQTLNDEMEKEVSMGPATFRIVDSSAATNSSIQSVNVENIKNSSKISKNSIKVLDSNGNTVKEVDFTKSKKFNVGSISFNVARVFKNAQISNNKIEEGDPAGSNPAMEVFVSNGKEKLREIIYQNIPEFSMNPNGLFGFKLAVNIDGSTSNVSESKMPANHPQIGGGSKGAGDRIKNTVEFKIVNNDQVEVELFKEGKSLMKKLVQKGEMVVTPWMGIELTFLGIKNATEPFIPMETVPKRKMPLPSSAFEIKTDEGNKWIVENTESMLRLNGETKSIYYGRERLFLPFSLALVKFEKNDYPGSEMAMNYKSYVKVNGSGETREIYMNEPLKMEGYTFYQSSYSLNPGSPALTILSVNKDPGRELKYIGSIILCLGIIIYTLQKSRRFQKFLN